MTPFSLTVPPNESYGALNTLGDCLTPMTPSSGDEYAFFRSFVAEQAAKDPELAAALAQLEQQGPADNFSQDKQQTAAPAECHGMPPAGKLLLKAASSSSTAGSQQDGLTSSVDAVVRVVGTDGVLAANHQQQAEAPKHQPAGGAAPAGLSPAAEIHPLAAEGPAESVVTKPPLVSRPSRSALIRPDFTQRQIKSLRRIFPIQSPLVKSAAALQGEYQLLDMLGSGAFGTAYKAWHLASGNLVCIKTVEGAGGEGLADVERQKREVAVLAALKHPNIIRYHDCFSDGSKLHIVMEWAEGGDLKGFIVKQAKAGTRLTEDQLLTYFVQIVSALAHIHAAGVMHRDIKTSNILFSSNGLLKLADFGIAKVLDAQGPNSSSSGSRISSSNGGASALVAAGASSGPMAQSFVGTPNYLAPEMINCEPYNQKADIWAIGCLLYEMAALRPAFRADRIPLVYRLIRRGRTAPLPSCYAAGLRALLQRLMANDPNDRPSSAQLLHEDLLRPYYEQYQQQLQQLGLELPPLPTPPSNDSLSGSTGISSSNGGYSNTVSISGVVTAVPPQLPQQQDLAISAGTAEVAAPDDHSGARGLEVSNLGQVAAAHQPTQQQQPQPQQDDCSSGPPSPTGSALGVGRAFMPRVSLLSITGSGAYLPITVAPDSARGLNIGGSNGSSVYNTHSIPSELQGLIHLQRITTTAPALMLGTEQGAAAASSSYALRNKQRHRMSISSAAGAAVGGAYGTVEFLPISHAGGGCTQRARIRRLTHHSVTGHIGNHRSSSTGGSSRTKQKMGFKAKLHRCLRKVFKSKRGSCGGGSCSSNSGGWRRSSSGGNPRLRHRRPVVSSMAGAADDDSPCVVVPAESLLISKQQQADGPIDCHAAAAAAASNSIKLSSNAGLVSSSNQSSSAGNSWFGSIMGDIRKGLPALRCGAEQQQQQQGVPPQLQFRLQYAGRYMNKTLSTVKSGLESESRQVGTQHNRPDNPAADGAAIAVGDDNRTTSTTNSSSAIKRPADHTASGPTSAAAAEPAAAAPERLRPAQQQPQQQQQQHELQPHELLYMQRPATVITAQHQLLGAHSSLSTITERSESRSTTADALTNSRSMGSGAVIYSSGAFSAGNSSCNAVASPMSVGSAARDAMSLVDAGSNGVTTPQGQEQSVAVLEANGTSSSVAAAAVVVGRLQQEQLAVLSALRQKQTHQKSRNTHQAAVSATIGPQQHSRAAAHHQRAASKPAVASSKQADGAAVVTIAGSAAAKAKLHQEQMAMLSKIQELRVSLSRSPSPVAGTWGAGDINDK